MKEQNKFNYKAGSYIYIEGDEAVDEVFIVEKGLVEFKRSNGQLRTQDKTAGPGDVFGFISSLSKRPRMETAFAKVNSIIIIFTREKFLQLLQKNSEIAIKLLDSYANDLRLYDNMIFPLVASKEMFLPVDLQLFHLGRYYYLNKMNSYAYYIFTRYLQLYPQGENMVEVHNMLDDVEKGGIKGMPKPVVEGIFRRYVDKQIIFCEHEPGDELFIIKMGKVKIIKYHNDNEIILSILKEGDIFGELAIVSDMPRNATAISYGTTELLPINKASMIKLINKSSDLLKRIFTAISQRVWFTFIRMESKFYEKPITRIYAFLENKLIEDNISLKNREPHTFNFGIDELIRMTNVPNEKISSIMVEVSRDQNLEFHFGQTLIENPSLVSSKARYYRSRDHLSEGNEYEDRVQAPIEKESGEIASVEIEKQKSLPLEKEPIMTTLETNSELFREMEDEIGKE